MVGEIFERTLTSLIFSIMRDEKRRKIMSMLGNKKLTADEITSSLKISRPAVEKHLKLMLEIGLIERIAETIPNLHYIYSIPDYSLDLISDIYEGIENFIEFLKEDYINRLEREEQLFLIGMSSKEKYEAIRQKHEDILRKLE
jgi:DNA-binding transcriptional ArsR family regulator